MKYDIFIASCYKDYAKLPYVIKSIFDNLTGFQNVYLCTPKKYNGPKLNFPIHYRIDMQVLKCAPNGWKYRPNWIYQQFIKLFQKQTENDYYFVIDSDTIINKPLELFENDQPIWRYFEAPQYNPPYYKFNQLMFGDSFDWNHTWLADMGLYSRKMIHKMLEHYGYTIDSFIKKSYKVIQKEAYPSEADIYMGYINKYYPTYYVVKQLKNKCNAIEGKNPFLDLWTRDMIEKHIEKMKKTDYETYAIHSWVDNSHGKWSQK
ncbi:MAG TPA: hypothetical protein VMV77_13455 [Bacteroidales bacterium]|nr:hypothetical protein [Bacteroidales bacterium]